MSVLNLLKRSSGFAFRTVTIQHRKSVINLRLTTIRFYSSSKFSKMSMIIISVSRDDSKLMTSENVTSRRHIMSY